MEKTITNLDIRSNVWRQNFTHTELRAIAKKHGITRGKDKRDTAFHLSQGNPFPFHNEDNAHFAGVKRIVFPVILCV